MNPESIPGGAFSVARKMFRSKIWSKDPLYLKVWIWIVGQANHSEHTKNNHKYQRGELVTTYDEIIKNTSHTYNRRRFYLTIKKIRVILRWLESENMILVKPLKSELGTTGADTRVVTRAYVGIKIIVINYDTYQDLKSYKGRHKGRHPTSQGHNNNNEEECNKNTVRFAAAKLYDFYKKHLTSGSRLRAVSNITRVLKHHSEDDLRQAILNYKNNTAGRDKQYLKEPANFFGVNEPFYLDYLPENFEGNQPEQTSPPAPKEITPENVSSLYEN